MKLLEMTGAQDVVLAGWKGTKINGYVYNFHSSGLPVK